MVQTGNVVIQLPWAFASSAWTLAQLGEASEALNRLREGEQLLDRQVTSGIVAFRGWADHSIGRACLSLGRLDEARSLGDRAVESSAGHHGFTAHALHLLGDIATHPTGSMPRAVKPITARRWCWPSRAACDRSSPTATSASANSTGARVSMTRLASTSRAR